MRKLAGFKAVKLILLVVLTGLTIFGFQYFIYEVWRGGLLELYSEHNFLFITLNEFYIIFPYILFWPELLIGSIMIFIVAFMHFRSTFELLTYVIGSFIVGSVTYNIYYVIAHPEISRVLQSLVYSIGEIMLIGLSLRFAFFIVGGFAGFYVRLRTVQKTTDIESMVLNYIKSRQGKIQISKCARELGIAKTQVEEILSRLLKKGLIEAEVNSSYSR